MATKLYILGLGPKIYAAHTSSRSYIVGMTSRMAAYNLGKFVQTKHTYADELPLIREIDYMDDEFYRMLKLNNFAVVVADDFMTGDNEIVFDGNVIDIEYQIDDDHRMYFERLLSID